ncbi:MAG TPA: Bax inhibitor-1/YccA family protein [Tepidisphaeraceae bacterium]|nr:Bax inhibitor-1/YccA family protein [Tepidisphaeraceae bacterium]
MSQVPNSFGSYRSQELEYESSENTITVGQFFNTVYAWMCVGLALTAVVAWYVAHSPLVNVIYASRGGYLMIGLAAFGIAWYAQSQAGRLSVGVATALFLVYAAIIGALISGIYLIYPARTLFAAFVLTGGTFGAMSVYGFVTKRDLSRIGSIMIMLVFGFFIASAVNMWLASNALSWVITYAILILFIGITAYETQNLRQIALQYQGDARMAHRYAIMGSLVLYIAFINLFLAILRILGDRR